MHPEQTFYPLLMFIFVINWRRSYRLPFSCFIPNQLMPSSGDGKLRPRLSHVSALLPLLQYVLELCKLCASHFRLCSLSKLFHISFNTNRNTETVPIPATADVFHVSLFFYVADQSAFLAACCCCLVNASLLDTLQLVALECKTWSEGDEKYVVILC